MLPWIPPAGHSKLEATCAAPTRQCATLKLPVNGEPTQAPDLQD